jgi:hypothetical protein
MASSILYAITGLIYPACWLQLTEARRFNLPDMLAAADRGEEV